MGIEDLGLLLENIEEYVMEQKKVVTYKWLSRTFSLNVNQAKQLLAIFHMKHKNMKHKSIQGVYYVSGMRRDSAGVLTHQICIVTEDLLEDTKAQLDPVTSVHLYSVQKGKPKETAPIYNVDFEQLKKKVYETTEFSMVRCTSAKISQVINSSLRPVTPPALKNKVTVMAQNSKPEIKKTFGTKSVPAKKPAVKKTVEPKKKQENLANFFGKGKAEAKKAEAKVKVEQKKSEASIIVETKKRETKPAKIIEEKEAVKIKTRESPRKREPLIVDDALVKNEAEQTSKLKSNGRTYKSGGKRKRVMQFSDDEDDQTKIDDEGICMEEEKLTETKSETKEETKESPESKKPRVRRKRVKKLVSKTSINEEGFMETEKVWEEHSCTDEEEEEKKPPPVVEDTKPTTRNKQSNLMGFFKKT